MTDWFHSILEHLYKDYPLDSSFVSLNDFLLSRLHIKEDDRIQATLLKKTFNSLKNRGFIEWGYNPKQEGASPFADDGNLNIMNLDTFKERMKTTTLKYHTISIYLTLAGFTYCHERELQKKRDKQLDRQTDSILLTNDSVRQTNVSTLRNFSIQKWLTISSIAVSLGALIISSIAFFKSDSKELIEQNKILERQLNFLDSIQQKIKPSPINSQNKEKSILKADSHTTSIDSFKKVK